MNEILAEARKFILTHARLLERRLFQVHFEGESPNGIAQVVRAYQNSDGGLWRDKDNTINMKSFLHK